MEYFFGSSSSSSASAATAAGGTPSTASASDMSPANRKLRCRIGTSLNNLTPYTINNEITPHFIDSELFTGHLVVRVRNFKGITADGSPPISDLAYFGTKKRMFSVQVSGRFKQEHTSDDILFGAEFQNKVNPPTGAWIAFKAANFIDPALQTELYSDKPWLYSPLLCAMNIVNVKDSKMDLPVYLSPDNKDISCNSTEVKPFETLTTADQSKSRLLPSDILGEWIWKNDKELDENNASLFEGVDCDEVVGNDDIAERRRFFQKEKNRKKNVFKPGKLYHFEIFAPFIDLNTFDLTLGINVNLLRYMNNQPIRLMSKSARKNQPIFIIEFDLLKPGSSNSVAAASSDEEQFHDAKE